ncbi:MAG TPA: beta galactosidase jelly roll domain-containing protein [Armatimonadota bacterium]|nr:beta galactosidase jelly roll domain-containing protein [Armatimonadota bacterium]
MRIEFTAASGAHDSQGCARLLMTGNAGWAIAALMLDYAPLKDAQSVSLWLRADKPATLNVNLSSHGDPWAENPLWGLQCNVSTTWQRFTLPFASLPQVHPAGKHDAIASTSIKSMIFTNLTPGVNYYVDDISAVVPTTESCKAEFTQRKDDITGWLRILSSRGLPLNGGAEHLANIETAFTAAPSEATLNALTPMENAVLTGRKLLRLKRQLQAIQDKQAGLSRVCHQRLPRDIEKEISACQQALDSAGWQFSSGSSISAATVANATESRLNKLYDRILPIWERADAGGKLRITVKNGAFLLPSGRPVTFWGWGTCEMLAVTAMPEVHLQAMAEMGNNVLRMVIPWENLERSQGNLASLQPVIDTLRMADRYGIYCTFDLHFGQPEWFELGPKDAPNLGNIKTYSNPFLDLGKAVADIHRRVAVQLKGESNLIGYETPLNEWFLDSNSSDLALTKVQAFPMLMADWNRWLKQQYGTREALQKAWSATPYSTADNGLHSDESWDTASIRPPGTRSVSAEYDTRIADYLHWETSIICRINDKIAQQIKTLSPSSLILQQPTAQTQQWCTEPLSLNLQSVMQSHTNAVDVIATHYSQGGQQDYLVNGVGCPHLDSETACNGRPREFVVHHAHNGGACLWCFDQAGYGTLRGQSWERTHDNLGRLYHGWFGWIGQMSDFQRDAWRVRTPKVLVIANTRRLALAKPDFLGTTSILEQLGLDFDLVTTQYLTEQPTILKRGYKAIIAGTSYADTQALQLLVNSGVPVLFVGDLNANDRAQFTGHPVAQFFEQNHLFIRTVSQEQAKSSGSPEIDLTGTWKFRTDPQNIGISRDLNGGWMHPEISDTAWDDQPVPAYWENINVLGKARDYDGVAWYSKHFTLPADWQGSAITLDIGAIDDYDDTYVNGIKIGSTGAETAGYWMAHRSYRIPNDILNFGGENTIRIRVNDIGGQGGMWKGPVRIIRTAQSWVSIKETVGSLTAGSRTASMDGSLRVQIAPSDCTGTVFATYDNTGKVAAIKDQRDWLWLADDALMAESQAHRQLLTSFLQQTGLLVPNAAIPTWAATSQVWHYSGYFTISQRGTEKQNIPLQTNTVLLPVYGGGTQRITSQGNSFIPMPGGDQSCAVLRESPLSLVTSTELSLTNISYYTYGKQGYMLSLKTAGQDGKLIWRGAKNAALTIDGRSVSWHSSDKSLTSPLPAGTHTVRITVVP